MIMPPFFGFFGSPDINHMEDKRDIEGLKRVLATGKTRAIKIEAAEALGKIGDDRAVLSLLSVLAHDDNDVRTFAAIALGRIGDPRAVEPLIATLSDHHHEVRSSAALALGKLADQRAVHPLLALAHDPYEEVRKAAQEALDNISEEGRENSPLGL